MVNFYLLLFVLGLFWIVCGLLILVCFVVLGAFNCWLRYYSCLVLLRALRLLFGCLCCWLIILVYSVVL